MPTQNPTKKQLIRRKVAEDRELKFKVQRSLRSNSGGGHARKEAVDKEIAARRHQKALSKLARALRLDGDDNNKSTSTHHHHQQQEPPLPSWQRKLQQRQQLAGKKRGGSSSGGGGGGASNHSPGGGPAPNVFRAPKRQLLPAQLAGRQRTAAVSDAPWLSDAADAAAAAAESAAAAGGEAALGEEIARFCAYVSPGADEVRARERLVEGLAAAARQQFGAGASVHVFGSFASALSTFLSDVDMTVVCARAAAAAAAAAAPAAAAAQQHAAATSLNRVGAAVRQWSAAASDSEMEGGGGGGGGSSSSSDSDGAFSAQLRRLAGHKRARPSEDGRRRSGRTAQASRRKRAAAAMTLHAPRVEGGGFKFVPAPLSVDSDSSAGGATAAAATAAAAAADGSGGDGDALQGDDSMEPFAAIDSSDERGGGNDGGADGDDDLILSFVVDTEGDKQTAAAFAAARLAAQAELMEKAAAEEAAAQAAGASAAAAAAPAAVSAADAPNSGGSAACAAAAKQPGAAPCERASPAGRTASARATGAGDAPVDLTESPPQSLSSQKPPPQQQQRSAAKAPGAARVQDLEINVVMLPLPAPSRKRRRDEDSGGGGGGSSTESECVPVVAVRRGPSAARSSGAQALAEKSVAVRQLALLRKTLHKQSWTASIVFIRHARIPILAMTTACGVECDVAWGAAPPPPPEGAPVGAAALRARWPALFPPLAVLLKVFLHQRGLDKVFSGGLGSHRMCVLLAQYLREAERDAAQQKRGASPLFAAGELGRRLLGFLARYSTTAQLNAKTSASVEGMEADFKPIFKIGAAVESFSAAHSALRAAMRNAAASGVDAAAAPLLSHIIHGADLRDERRAAVAMARGVPPPPPEAAAAADAVMAADEAAAAAAAAAAAGGGGAQTAEAARWPEAVEAVARQRLAAARRRLPEMRLPGTLQELHAESPALAARLAAAAQQELDTRHGARGGGGSRMEMQGGRPAKKARRQLAPELDVQQPQQQRSDGNDSSSSGGSGAWEGGGGGADARDAAPEACMTKRQRQHIRKALERRRKALQALLQQRRRATSGGAAQADHAMGDEGDDDGCSSAAGGGSANDNGRRTIADLPHHHWRDLCASLILKPTAELDHVERVILNKVPDIVRLERQCGIVSSRAAAGAGGAAAAAPRAAGRAAEPHAAADDAAAAAAAAPTRRAAMSRSQLMQLVQAVAVRRMALVKRISERGDAAQGTSGPQRSASRSGAARGVYGSSGGAAAAPDRLDAGVPHGDWRAFGAPFLSQAAHDGARAAWNPRDFRLYNDMQALAELEEQCGVGARLPFEVEVPVSKSRREKMRLQDKRAARR